MQPVEPRHLASGSPHGSGSPAAGSSGRIPAGGGVSFPLPLFPGCQTSKPWEPHIHVMWSWHTGSLCNQNWHTGPGGCTSSHLQTHPVCQPYSGSGLPTGLTPFIQPKGLTSLTKPSRWLEMERRNGIFSSLIAYLRTGTVLFGLSKVVKMRKLPANTLAEGPREKGHRSHETLWAKEV